MIENFGRTCQMTWSLKKSNDHLLTSSEITKIHSPHVKKQSHSHSSRSKSTSFSFVLLGSLSTCSLEITHGLNHLTTLCSPSLDLIQFFHHPFLVCEKEKVGEKSLAHGRHTEEDDRAKEEDEAREYGWDWRWRRWTRIKLKETILKWKRKKSSKKER